MKRGVVMSIHKQHVVVMTAGGQFLQAPLSGEPQLGEEIVFEEEYISSKRSMRLPRHLLSVAALIMVVSVSVLLIAMRSSNPVVAYVSMDINPSIEFGIDHEEQVRELRALNSDGEVIIAGIDYKGKSLEEVALAVIEQASQSHYLDNPGKDIVITSILLDDVTKMSLNFDEFLAGKLSETLIGKLTSLEADSVETNVTLLTVPKEMRNVADANGISSGKLAVYLMAKDEGFEVELEQFKEESIDNVVESIGGVRKIVDNAEDMSKEKLKQLLEQEQAEKQAKTVEKATPSPSPKATAPASTAKNASKTTAKPDDSKSGQANGKDNKQNQNSKGNDKKDIDRDSKWNDKRSNNENNDNRDKRDNKDTKDKKDKQEADYKNNKTEEREEREKREERKEREKREEREDREDHDDRNKRYDDRNDNRNSNQAFDRNDRNDGKGKSDNRSDERYDKKEYNRDKRNERDSRNSRND